MFTEDYDYLSLLVIHYPVLRMFLSPGYFVLNMEDIYLNMCFCTRLSTILRHEGRLLVRTRRSYMSSQVTVRYPGHEGLVVLETLEQEQSAMHIFLKRKDTHRIIYSVLSIKHKLY